MISTKQTDRIAQRLTLDDVRNILAQANARYILYGVREDEANFPHFAVGLTSKAHTLAYLHIEVACSYCEAEMNVESTKFFERGAELLEYNNATIEGGDDNVDFNLMVCSLAYYCACQYSKAFIVLRGRVFNTPVGKMLHSFLRKDFTTLENLIKEAVFDAEVHPSNVYGILLARSLELVINYYYYGEETYLKEATDIVNDAEELALIGSDPAVWWFFRLFKIVVNGIKDGSLWANIGNNLAYKVNDGGWIEAFKKLGIDYCTVFDNTAKLKLRQYINSLAFRNFPVTELFWSQRKALEKILGSEGAVVSMPTSSGKTRIAEMAVLQTLMFDGASKVLYIAPFRSLSYEMEETFSNTFNPMEYYVTHLYGGAQYTALDRQEMEEARVIIATPEKAKAILRTNDELVNAIRLVIMDEGHLLGPGSREVSNEMFSEELRRIVKNNNGRFLVLSAVLPNASDMALWLTGNTENVAKDEWRPSNSRFGKLLCYNSRLDIEWKDSPRCYNHSFVTTGKPVEKKYLVALAARKLSELGSILIYCPTPAQVKSNANVMLQLLEEEPDVDWGEDFDWIRFNLICRESEEDELYARFAEKGILCHSAALKSDVRRYMERLLRKGKAKYIYATNTLAQGVNLGVSTVIVLGTMISRDVFLTNRDFWNMAGRAGRSFVDTEGKILFVCDCKDQITARKQNWVADKYLSSSSLDNVYSGIYILLKKLKKMQVEAGIGFEYLLQLIAENNLAEFEGTEQFFELIDDSLFALDLEYRESDTDDAIWVEEHFKWALGVIQEEDEKEREKNMAILKARVFATRKMTHERPMPQSFAASGIPLMAALYLEDNIERIRTLAEVCIEQGQDLDSIVDFFTQFDGMIVNIPSSRLMQYEEDELSQIRDNWFAGRLLQGKRMDVAEKYYGFTVTWLLNALAGRFATEDEEEYKAFFETMSLLSQYGLPNRWAVCIYLAGINSRKVATEISLCLDEPSNTERVSQAAKYLESHSQEIIQREDFSELAKEWIRSLMSSPKTKTKMIPSVSRFTISDEAIDSDEHRLLCKRHHDKVYLCSPNMRRSLNITEAKIEGFSQVADVPGVFFEKKGDSWNMECHNPYVQIKY